MRYYSYREFLEDFRKLRSAIDFPFDTILAVSRGGLTLAHFLAEYFGIRRLYTVTSIGYEGRSKLEGPAISKLPDLSGSRRVLVVDDIVDSGDTLEKLLELLRDSYPEIEFRSAVLFTKPSAKVEADYSAATTTEWIQFFWTRDSDGSDDR
ncbi:MAG: phosphoribosyltransferase [Epsilonproteobacteria bacterium]|nr:phosphoribosyltransferase [Campylobacterota bacterium]